MSIQLYLIRHGIAGDREQYDRDEDRPLTPKGREKTQQIAQRLKALELAFDEVLTSPLVRAYQTAEILMNEGLAVQMSIHPDLSPLGSFSNWLIWLDTWQQSSHRTLALVGHEPDLSQWAELLIWGESRRVLVLKKAGIIGITLPETGDPVGKGELFWLTSPKFLLAGRYGP